MHRFHHHERGIATGELILIMIVLAAIVMLSFPLFISGGFEEKLEETKSQIIVFNVVLEQYRKENPSQTYPLSAEFTPIGEVPGIVGRYLGRAPESPFGTPYLYASDGQTYTIIVSLEGGADGFEGGGNDNLRYESATGRTLFF